MTRVSNHGRTSNEAKGLSEFCQSIMAAIYQVSYKGWIPKLLGLSDGDVTTKVMSIHYCYPHFVNRLEGISALYLMRLPVSRTESRAFSILLTKSPIPRWMLNPLRPILLAAIVHLIFLRFLKQDIEMIESEQENYLKNPHRRYVEINPAIVALTAFNGATVPAVFSHPWKICIWRRNKARNGVAH